MNVKVLLWDWKDPSGAAIWVNTAVKTQALPQLCLISHKSINEPEMLHAPLIAVRKKEEEASGSET